MEILTNMPKRNGKENKINWKESIGLDIEILYKNEKFKIYIKDYKKYNNSYYLTLVYKDIEKNIRTGDFIRGKISELIKTSRYKYKYNIRDIIKDVKILKQIRIFRKDKNCTEKGYIVECLRCGNVFDVFETKINKNKCPECIIRKSYPEKFIAELLKQLNVQFTKEKIFPWSRNIAHINLKISGNKRYDFYFKFNNKKYLTEANGRQHYEENCFSSCDGRTLNEEIENDRIKKELALSNGFNEKSYIVIDCRKSELEHIKNSILTSQLNEIFDLSKINWNNIHKNIYYTNIKPICDLFNGGIINPKVIGENFNLSQDTVRKYLKIGTKLGMCNYDPKINKSKAISFRDFDYKKAICITNNKKYESLQEASKIYNLQYTNMSANCLGKRNYCGKDDEENKLIWLYLDDYNYIVTNITNEPLNNYSLVKKYLKSKYQ
jgi:hypothetical protein